MGEFAAIQADRYELERDGNAKANRNGWPRPGARRAGSSRIE